MIYNLIINAAHAIAEMNKKDTQKKGEIKISTQGDSEWVVIKVSDSGIGIPEEIQSSIFNPFFTTKDIGKGAGQGLATAHNIITEKHRGIISFETQKNKGTTFTIRLPMSDETRY